MEHWVKNLSQFHFFDHKSHTDWPGINEQYWDDDWQG
jgi:hypothetical protein